MAKGASTEVQMGNLHSKLTNIFIKILTKYDNDLGEIDIEEEMADALINEPNPAMLGAITKFLKDNSITIESQELDELSAMEQRLADKKAKRPNLASVTNLPLQNGG